MARYERFDSEVSKPKLKVIRRSDDPIDPNHEKLDLFVSSDLHTFHSDESMSRHALITLNIISIVISTVCGSITFFLAVEDQSVSALGFAIDTILDVLAFSIIIWRFTSNEEQVQREINSLRVLAVLFLISGLAVFIDSILDLRNETHPVHNDYLVTAVAVQTLIFLCLAIGKYLVAKRLDLISAYSDALNTTISALMAFSVALSIKIYNAYDNVWYLDPLIGMSFAILMMVYGVWMIVKSLFL